MKRTLQVSERQGKLAFAKYNYKRATIERERRYTMQMVSMCDLCQRAYAPETIQGVRKLKEFRGYTVDIRLQEFRKAVDGKAINFIPFASSKGQQLLKQMHEEVMQ